jgi:hypothetical protein
MKCTVTALVLLTVGAFFVPQLVEGANSPCDALAIRKIRESPKASKDPLALILAHTVGGSVASMLASERYPQVPPGVTCATVYWFGGDVVAARK